MQKRIKTDVISNLDRPVILIYMILVLMGWFNIYAAVYNDEHQSILDISQQYGKQMVWIIAAGVLAAILLIIESRFYVVFSYPIYAFIMFMLVAVLLFGREVNGARSWFEIGSIRLQPAEFAKLATCLAMSKYLSQYHIKIHRLRTIIKVGAFLGIPALLILLQNDTGSAIVYSSFVLMLYRQGLSGKFLLLGLFIVLLFFMSLIFDPQWISMVILIMISVLYFFYRKSVKETLVGMGVYSIVLLLCWFAIEKVLHLENSDPIIYLTSLLLTVAPFGYFAFRYKLKVLYLVIAIAVASVSFTYSVEYIFNNVLEKHQRTRINVLLGTESDPHGAEYNVNQSKIAIGSGGFSGKGFLQGTQTKFNFVPEQSTDFIFCTVGEEWGFVGTFTVIAIFLALLLRLVYMAERQRSDFSRIYGYGVVGILFFHLAINVGMTIGLAPVIGIPLPFFSYGGSSLWAFTILLFVFIKLDADRDRLIQ